MVYTFDKTDEQASVPALIRALTTEGVAFSDLNTRQSSLEDIFVSLVHENA